MSTKLNRGWTPSSRAISPSSRSRSTSSVFLPVSRWSTTAKLVAVGGGAGAALGAVEDVDLTRLLRASSFCPVPSRRTNAVERGAKRLGGHRLGQVVRHPGPHRGQQVLRLEQRARRDESDAGRGLAQELGELDAQLGGVIDVEDEQLGVELPQRADLLLTEATRTGP